MRERNRINSIRAVCLALLCVLLGLLCPAAALAAEESGERVFDDAGLFEPEKISQLNEKIQEIRERTHIDAAVVTTGNSRGKTAREYADDFYDDHKFGTGKDYNGALFLIDMDNREIAISTSGIMRRYLTDERIESMLDQIYECVSSGDYEGSADVFLDGVQTYYRKGIQEGQYIYDEDTGEISVYRSIRWYEWLLALGVSLFTAVSACLAVVRRYGMKRERRQASNYNMAYRAGCNFIIRDQSDQLINKYVSQTVIPRHTSSSGGGVGRGAGGRSTSGRSTVHRSSSGRSHGGGSRKF